MATVASEPLLHGTLLQFSPPKLHSKPKKSTPFSLNYLPRSSKFGGRLCRFNPPKLLSRIGCSASAGTVTKTAETADDVYAETIPLNRAEKVEGRTFIRLGQGKDVQNWELTVGCSIPGKWVLHWGVHNVGGISSEWDQPPIEMRPPDSIAIKDYAIETPLKKLSESKAGDCLHEVKIPFNCNSKIAAINFVLKDEETGSWYQHKGRDFRVSLVDYLREGGNVVGAKKGFSLWTGVFGHLSEMLLKPDGPQSESQNIGEESAESNQSNRQLEGFYEELPIVKEVPIDNFISISVKKCPETAKDLVSLETDLPGDVVVHWGVCRDSSKNWELPRGPHPPDTEVFKKAALRTRLQRKADGSGSAALFTLNEALAGFLFVLKLDDNTWLNDRGNDFFIPLSNNLHALTREDESRDMGMKSISESSLGSVERDNKTVEENQEASHSSFTDGIIKEIRNLVTDISSEKKWKTKSKEAQESILQEIEKLAAEAYSIFRSSIPSFSKEAISDPDTEVTGPETKMSLSKEAVSDPDTEVTGPVIKICSGTGSGYEILCQGFNWESHKSGRWYVQLHEKAAELSSLGFTTIWLPPPTESVSPEGYMPKDVYNLNSRYGNIDELRTVVKKFHEVGMKVLGDAVLNHRCAHHQNQNGIWNIFGGRLNWDDRAVVSDDPHFQGRGNKSSGDNFHAAPNIDHSQDFVRKDLKEWLCWLRQDIGYDGWRLDFVRGFWGGYVKDYIDATEPYFAVGEYWDSLSYAYGEMDYNQDAHRQRIIDWINDAGGTAGAFDVTTKGILHAALDKCEYWRLSDPKRKPPGVLGWWPSRAVTFIENHDTGSTQGHWRFPGGKEMQGYAYILTHPGTPSVFYDHIFSSYQREIAALLSLRNRKKIHCRSTVKIVKAERDVYAAVVDDKVAMKIGPGSYEPPSGSRQWSLAVEGHNYKVWEAL